MQLPGQITNAVVRWQYRRVAKALATRTPEEICTSGERKLLQAFQRAARDVPAYRALLAEAGVKPEEITSAAEFTRRVPILTKESVFSAHELRDLCGGGNLEHIASFHSSSGHSGVFSYGVETRDGLANSALGVEFLLDVKFETSRRKTLLINCLPMGVKATTRTLPVANTSVRADVIFALLRKLKGDFEQFILIGESPFLKRVLEEGPANGVVWQELRVHLITGAEFIAENMRRYFAYLVGHDLTDPTRGQMLVNMGLSELTLSIFMESFETAQMRRLAQESADFRAALIGPEQGACPVIMQYFPEQTYIEAIPAETGRPELVVSLLGTDVGIPLMRYNTRDVVRLVGYQEFEQRLRDLGHEALLPKFRLPFALVWGKRQWVQVGEGERLSPDEVKEALYQDFDLAGKVTGNFRLAGSADGGQLLVQLREGADALPDMKERLAAHLSSYTRRPVSITLSPYREYPYGFAHDFERKNQYV